MCQPKKTRRQIVQQAYLTKSDISRLLGISQARAKRIYDEAVNKIDGKMEFRVEPTKIKITSLCKVTGYTIKTLQQLILNDEVRS